MLAARAFIRGREEGRVAENLLAIENVTIGYGRGTTALNGVSLAVPDGQVVSVLGSNGAGKSTLLRAICGTLPLHGGSLRSGQVMFDGIRIDGRQPAAVVAAGIRLVPEGRQIFAGMTVEENLLIGGLRGISRRQRRVRLREIYEAFPVLERRRHQRAILLSGGEQQMLAVGRGLMGRPRLLMLDEPSLGLAPTMIGQVARLIESIAQQGTAILLAEQNASMALRLARQVVVLRTGTVAFAGGPAQLRADEDLHRVYFGSSGTGENRPAVTGPAAS
jgi:branched-chain amino acid transport system ATP-binding protein